MRAARTILGGGILVAAATAIALLAPRSEEPDGVEDAPGRVEDPMSAPRLETPAPPAHVAVPAGEEANAWVRVLRRDDTPVAQAKVEIRDAGPPSHVPPPAASSTETDATGLAVLRGRPDSDWVWVFAAASPGAAARLVATSAQRPQVVRVQPTSGLAVRLLRADGTAAAGALATLPTPWDRTAHAADEEGRVTWPARPTEPNVSVVAWDPRDGSRAVVRVLDLPGDGTIVLRAGIPVDVLVTGADGRPVAEAIVELRFQDAVLETVPAPEGRARVLAPANAADRGWVLARSGALQGAASLSRRGGPVEVRLRELVVLDVLVSDAATRAPLVGAEVVPIGEGATKAARTGEDGHARLEAPRDLWEPDHARLDAVSVRAVGYAETVRALYGHDPARPVEIPMARGRRVRVLVLDASGSPVPGAQVHVLDARPEYALDASASVRFTPERTTDPQGVVEIDGLRADTRVGVVAFAPRLGWAVAQIGPGEDPGDLRLVLAPGHSLAVRVTDPDGVGIPSARVASIRRTTAPSLGGTFVDAVCAATTDGAGIADLRDVPAGCDELTVSGEGWFARRVRLDPGAARIDVTLLRRATIEGRIDGVPARPDGRAHEVRAMPLGRANPYEEEGTSFSPPAGIADEEGRFRLDRCIPGSEYLLTIPGLSDESGGAGGTRVRAPAAGVVLRGADVLWTRVVLAFPASATPRGLYAEASGSDRAGKTVAVRSAAPLRLEGSTWELPVPRGEVSFRITAMDACTWMDAVRVVEDGQRVDVPMRTAPLLLVRVTDPRGGPVSDAEVRLEISPTRPQDSVGRANPWIGARTARTRRDGTCEVPPPWRPFRFTVGKGRSFLATPEHGLEESGPFEIVFDPDASPPLDPEREGR